VTDKRRRSKLQLLRALLRVEMSSLEPGTVCELDDRDLDCWLAEFVRRRSASQRS
jgi:hypothetical protein